MKSNLRRSVVIRERRDKLTESRLAHDRRDRQRRVERYLSRQPTNQHGLRLKKRDAQINENLFLFLDDASIAPTHNSSHQAIRMGVIFRQVTNGFRSEWGRDVFAAVGSVVNTGQRPGLSACQSIRKAVGLNSSLFEPS